MKRTIIVGLSVFAVFSAATALADHVLIPKKSLVATKPPPRTQPPGPPVIHPVDASVRANIIADLKKSSPPATSAPATPAPTPRASMYISMTTLSNASSLWLVHMGNIEVAGTYGAFFHDAVVDPSPTNPAPLGLEITLNVGGSWFVDCPILLNGWHGGISTDPFAVEIATTDGALYVKETMTAFSDTVNTSSAHIAFAVVLPATVSPGHQGRVSISRSKPWSWYSCSFEPVN